MLEQLGLIAVATLQMWPLYVQRTLWDTTITPPTTFHYGFYVP